MYENARNILFGLLLCCCLFNCGRFGRRVLEVHKTDTILVNAGRVVDSVFIFSKTRDTLRTQYLTIYRDSDHFRYYFRERTCTTHINRTTIQPERIRTEPAKGQTRALGEIANIITALALFMAFLFLFRAIKK